MRTFHLSSKIVRDRLGMNCSVKSLDDEIEMPLSEADRATASNMVDADPVAQERRSALVGFKTRGRRLGIKITDPMVAQAANQKWNDRTMITWWKRNDDGCKPRHDRMIRAVLARDPATIWQPRGHQ